jgi:8-oxo-dGTP pyrophosphatase MutT (NUDIX family)
MLVPEKFLERRYKKGEANAAGSFYSVDELGHIVFLLAPTRSRFEPRHLEYKLPGGKSENDETPFETLRRELCEEIGLEVTTAYPTHYYRVPHDKGTGWHYRFFFSCGRLVEPIDLRYSFRPTFWPGWYGLEFAINNIYHTHQEALESEIRWRMKYDHFFYERVIAQANEDKVFCLVLYRAGLLS